MLGSLLFSFFSVDFLRFFRRFLSFLANLLTFLSTLLTLFRTALRLFRILDFALLAFSSLLFRFRALTAFYGFSVAVRLHLGLSLCFCAILRLGFFLSAFFCGALLLLLLSSSSSEDFFFREPLSLSPPPFFIASGIFRNLITIGPYRRGWLIVRVIKEIRMKLGYIGS